jgi:hypothetical protein
MLLIPENANVNVQSVTGGQAIANQFIPWQPSTWPKAPPQFNAELHQRLKRIFQETMLDELHNVVEDIKKANPQNQYPMMKRGHVVAVAYMCALDTIASYGYKVHKGGHMKSFVKEHFPPEYKPFAKRIYADYRLPLVHSWNLFGDGALVPGNDAIKRQNGLIRVGILNFVDSFEKAVGHFLDKLATDKKMQQVALRRYRSVGR